MKKIVLSLSIVLCVAACTGIKSTSTGIENQCFLSFFSPTMLTDGEYDNEVTVYLKPQGGSVVAPPPFQAKVNRVLLNSTKKQKRPAGTVYGVKTGVYMVKVVWRDKIIYHKKLLLANQETRIIELP
jgi:hypothetical protein